MHQQYDIYYVLYSTEDICIIYIAEVTLSLLSIYIRFFELNLQIELFTQKYAFGGKCDK